MKARLALLVLVCSVAAAAIASPSSPTAPSSPPTAFQGTVAGTGNQSGTLTVTVQTVVAASSASFFGFPFVATLHAQTTTVAATGSLHLIGGSTIALTGTFDSSPKAFHLSGGGFSSLSVTSSVVTSYLARPNRHVHPGESAVLNAPITMQETI